jgi:hypothetical protein
MKLWNGIVAALAVLAPKAESARIEFDCGTAITRANGRPLEIMDISGNPKVEFNPLLCNSFDQIGKLLTLGLLDEASIFQGMPLGAVDVIIGKGKHEGKAYQRPGTALHPEIGEYTGKLFKTVLLQPGDTTFTAADVESVDISVDGEAAPTSRRAAS